MRAAETAPSAVVTADLTSAKAFAPVGVFAAYPGTVLKAPFAIFHRGVRVLPFTLARGTIA